MDRKLVGWARAVKARVHAGRRGMPVLWLVTDSSRMPDPRAAVALLPAGSAGVVLRHDDDPERRRLARDLARLCRARRLLLSVAGDWRMAAAVHAGLHLRGGRRPAGAPRWLRAWTSSAHGAAELRRARRTGALPLLSPAFATLSHPAGPVLGPVRWGLLARLGGAGALGGVTGATIRRLPPAWVRAAAAIGAFGIP